MGTKQNFRSWFQPPWHFVTWLLATFLGVGELNGEGQGRMAASLLEEVRSSQVPYPTAEPGPRSLARHLGGSQSVAKSARTTQALPGNGHNCSGRLRGPRLTLHQTEDGVL